MFFSSAPGKSFGVLHLIEAQSDFDYLLTNPPAPPYAAIILPKDFTRENVLRLRDSTFVSAVVLINDTRGIESFSQELSCPNQFFAHSSQPYCNSSDPDSTWNPYGTGLLHENFDIPIMFIPNKNESDKLIKCYNEFNKKSGSQMSRSLCSIEINSLMSAAGNTEICLRRSENTANLLNRQTFCDPLQGKNIYGTLFPRKIVNPENRTVDKNEKIIVISARFDTTSMFDGLGLGAVDSLASVATLLTTGHFLRKVLKETNDQSNINVLFVLFNGESYDFIGSQRLVYDLKKGDAFPSPSTFSRPLDLENILMMIDIGNLDSLDELSFYQLENTTIGEKFLNAMKSYLNYLEFDVKIESKITKNIPPVSIQSFLREDPSFPGFAVATQKPRNKFDHSIYDDIRNLNFTYHNSSSDFDELYDTTKSSKFEKSSVQVKIRNIATLIALGVHDIINEDKKYSDNLIASAGFVDELLYCYLVASNCELFKVSYESSEGYKGSDFPPLRYVSVQAAGTNEATFLAHSIFGFILSGKFPDISKENCTVLPQRWIPGVSGLGECRLTTQNFSLAKSPAFSEPGYDFKSNKYSSWTESTWSVLSARIFLSPSATHESLTFSIGFSVMILSFAFVYLINSKADVLFAGDQHIEQ
jgi:nicastrin